MLDKIFQKNSTGQDFIFWKYFFMIGLHLLAIFLFPCYLGLLRILVSSWVSLEFVSS